MRSLPNILLAGLLAVALATGGPAHGIDPVGPDAVAGCRPFEATQEIRSVPSWDAIEIVHRQPRVSPEAARAALERQGGARMVFAVDIKSVRRELLETSRDDLRRLMRETRTPAIITIRGDTIEVAPRTTTEPARIASMIAPLTAGPYALLAERAADPGQVARGAVVLAVTEHAVADRVRVGELGSIEILERRLAEIGIANAAVVAESGGRIVIVAPGLTSLEPLVRMMQILPMRARLTFHLADTSADACAAAAPSPDFEIMRTLGSKIPLLVEKRVRIAGENVADAVVALDARTRAPSVVFRLDLRGSDRLSELTRTHPNRVLAIALDHEIIAAPVIVESIGSGIARIAGGLDLPRGHEFALLLRAGIFPAPLLTVEQGVVPPPR